MVENAEQKRRRIMGKQFLPKYMDSLNEILIKIISSNDLLSIVETDYFYSQVDYEKSPRVKNNFIFCKKKC